MAGQSRKRARSTKEVDYNHTCVDSDNHVCNISCMETTRAAALPADNACRTCDGTCSLDYGDSNPANDHRGACECCHVSATGHVASRWARGVRLVGPACACGCDERIAVGAEWTTVALVGRCTLEHAAYLAIYASDDGDDSAANLASVMQAMRGEQQKGRAA